MKVLPSHSNDLIDFHIKSLQSFKDIHKGKRAFIIGNGPSLSVSDLDLMVDEISFAANKIYLLFNQTRFRPSYYTSVDLIFLENFHEKVEKLDFIKFIPEWGKKWFEESNSMFFFKEKGNPINKGFKPGFSYNIDKGIYGGYTVSYTNIQLAFYMGIRELYLVGMDHTYNLPEKRTHHEKYGNVLVSDGEVNHFCNDYRQEGEIWSVPRPEYQEMAFKMASEKFKASGGKIINITRGGNLEIFQDCL